jgi:hypothetical protein
MLHNLQKLDWRKNAYFKWKHQIRTPRNEHILKMSPDDFLECVERESFVSFEKWEQTQEYFELFMLYL